MARPRGTRKASASGATRSGQELARRLLAARTQFAYVLPYYTRGGSDTEYLISNPNASPLTGTLAVFGKRCEVARGIRFRLDSNCTRTIRIRAIVPENAGHSVIVVTGEVIGHLLYLRADDTAIVGGELAGRGNLIKLSSEEKSRTYGFGYRAVALGATPVSGAVFVSNPLAVPLTGVLIFYDQKCQPLPRRRVAVKPGCTAEYPFPANRYGYGRIQLSGQAGINVLHFLAKTGEIGAAELLDEGNRVSGPPSLPTGRSKILFDYTHVCHAGLGFMTKYEAALTASGYTVSHHTATTVTLSALQAHHLFIVSTPRTAYSASESKAIADFVNSGGSLMILQDFGNAPWSAPTRQLLNAFGASDDNNFVDDPTNHFPPGDIDNVVFDSTRNFFPHPILTGVTSFHVDAASSLSGDSNWTTIVESDDDSIPARRPMIMVRPFGAGRILACGDASLWSDNHIVNLDNKLIGVRCAEWLLFRI